MNDCKECGQTIENCECHIPSKEKNKGLFDLCKMKPKGTLCRCECELPDIDGRPGLCGRCERPIIW